MNVYIINNPIQHLPVCNKTPSVLSKTTKRRKKLTQDQKYISKIFNFYLKKYHLISNSVWLQTFDYSDICGVMSFATTNEVNMVCQILRVHLENIYILHVGRHFNKLDLPSCAPMSSWRLYHEYTCLAGNILRLRLYVSLNRWPQHFM